MEEYFLLDVIGLRKRFEKEYKIIRQNDGQERWVVGYGDVKYSESGDPQRMIGAIMDITERKEAELQRESLINQLVQRNNDLEQFSYIVSHNLRAPLANLIGLTTLVKENEMSETELKNIIEKISICVENFDNVIRDLNHILEVKSRLHEDWVFVDFKTLVEGVQTSLGIEIQKENAKIICNFSEVAGMETNRGYLHSIFLNLITNAIKYRKPELNPIIEISSALKDNTLTISFCDNGLGIDLETNDKKIFGLYKRFNSNVAGKGMGLFITKTQVELLGGKIFVESEVGVGTIFRLEFELNRQ